MTELYLTYQGEQICYAVHSRYNESDKAIIEAQLKIKKIAQI